MSDWADWVQKPRLRILMKVGERHGAVEVEAIGVQLAFRDWHRAGNRC